MKWIRLMEKRGGMLKIKIGGGGELNTVSMLMFQT